MARIITTITGPFPAGQGGRTTGFTPRMRRHTYAWEAEPHGTSLRTISTNLRGSAKGIRPAVRKAVQDSAKDTRDTWRRLYQASEVHRHAPSYAKAITWDRDRTGMADYGAEIGPDKNKRQGALGNLIEFGSVNNTPQLEGQRALAVEGPQFVERIRAVARLDI